MQWRTSNIEITEWKDDFFAFIITCEGHLAWYVIDDAKGILCASGSDDTIEAARLNAETALYRAESGI